MLLGLLPVVISKQMDPIISLNIDNFRWECITNLSNLKRLCAVYLIYIIFKLSTLFSYSLSLLHVLGVTDVFCEEKKYS